MFYDYVEAGAEFGMGSYITHPWAIYTVKGNGEYNDKDIQVVEVVNSSVDGQVDFVFDLFEQNGRIWLNINGVVADESDNV